MPSQPTNYCLWATDTICFPSSEWAAWVQAVGSIIAILIAIAIAAWQHHSAQRSSSNDRLLQGRAMALQLIAPLRQWQEKVSYQASALDEKQTQSLWVWLRDTVKLPTAVETVAHNTHLLGAAAHDVQDMLRKATHLAEDVRLALDNAAFAESPAGEVREECARRMKSLVEAIQQARAALESLFILDKAHD